MVPEFFLLIDALRVCINAEIDNVYLIIKD